MKDEIKEILDRLLKYLKESNINDFGYEKDKLISYEEAQILLDYITNLQERKITKEDVDKYFEENMMVSFDKFIENWKEQEKLTKYLQEENQIEKYKTLKDLQDRIDKAIIFLKEAQEGLEEYHFDGYDPCLNECINILKGDKDE